MDDFPAGAAQFSDHSVSDRPSPRSAQASSGRWQFTGYPDDDLGRTDNLHRGFFGMQHVHDQRKIFQTVDPGHRLQQIRIARPVYILDRAAPRLRVQSLEQRVIVFRRQPQLDLRPVCAIAWLSIATVSRPFQCTLMTGAFLIRHLSGRTLCR
jgi:hypothetical protein